MADSFEQFSALAHQFAHSIAARARRFPEGGRAGYVQRAVADVADQIELRLEGWPEAPKFASVWRAWVVRLAMERTLTARLQ